MRSKKALFTASFALALGLTSSDASAFKTGTHVWIGQQVLNNLNTCTRQNGDRPCVFVERGAQRLQLPVAKEVADALNANPETYRMGHIGPDAYPGVLEGQMIIHPGITSESGGKVTKTGFGTGEWMDHLLRRARAEKDAGKRSELLAFGYGFLGHAAGDVFAHTYVNMYSGDTFVLTDGETEVESRHFALETYIDGMKPPFLDAQGRNLGTATQLITKSGGGLAVPAESLRDIFFYDPTAQNELEKTKAKHIIAINQIRSGLKALLCQKDSGLDVKQLGKQIAGKYVGQNGFDRNQAESRDLSSIKNDLKDYAVPRSGCPLQEIEMLAIQILADYYLDLGLTKQEAAAVLEIKLKIDNFIKEKGEKVLKVKDKIFDLNKKVLKYENAAAQAQYKALRASVQAFDTSVDKLEDALQTKNEVEEDILRLNDKMQKKFTSFRCEALDWTCPDADFKDKVVDVVEYSCQVPKQVERMVNKTEEYACKTTKPVDYACKKQKSVCRKALGWLGKKASRKLCKVVDVASTCTALREVDDVCTRVVKVPRIEEVMVNTTCKKNVVKWVVDKAAKGQCLAAKGNCVAAETEYKIQKKALQAQLDAKKKLQKEAIALVGEATEQVDRSLQGLANAHKGIYEFNAAMIDTVAQQENAVFEMSMRLQQGMIGIFQGWADDVDKAMTAYVSANGQAIFNSMDGQDDTHTFEPLANWVDCYAPMIVGIPGPAIQGVCAAKDVADEFEKLRTTLHDSKLKFFPKIVEKVSKGIENYKTKVLPKAGEQALLLALQAIGEGDGDMNNLIHFLHDTVPPGELDEAFNSGDGGKNLVLLQTPGQRMSDRVNHDMHLSAGKFDPKKFPPVANAVTLATLALLDADGLNSLLAQSGVAPLYAKTSNDNVITHSVQSIDGNHQWMSLAPPFPRQGTFANDTAWAGSRDRADNIARRFSLQASQNPAYGFKLFDGAARKAVFEKIFIGPVIPSLANDSVFDRVLPVDYPFEVDADEPFGVLLR